MSSKINLLLKQLKPGSIVLQSWLSEQGISRQLASKYVQSGWLQRISSGVYVRPGGRATWADAVAALSQQAKIPIRLASLTSLNYQGRAHYLKLNEDQIWLSTSSKAKLPQWFKRFAELESEDLSPQRPKLNFQQYTGLDKVSEQDFIQVDVNGVSLGASRPELAAFELLDLVPDKISFEHAAQLFEGLVGLSPRRIQSILARSQSIKINRLYLFLAHYYEHSWAKRLDETLINQGSGKRQIVKGGKLDQTYQITIPQSFRTLKDANG